MAELAKRGEEPFPALVNHYRGHKGSILSLAFHPNTKTVFSSSADGYVMTWDYGKESRALRFEGHCGPVNEVGLSTMGDLMVTCSDDSTARVWVPTIKGEYVTVKGHSAPVRSATFNPVDSSMFATGSNDKTVKLWSVLSCKTRSGFTKFKSHNFIASFRKHRNWVRCVRFSSDGRLICSVSDDKSIRVFDVRSEDEVAAMECDLGSPLHVEFNPCGQSFLGVSTTERAFLMYDIREKKLLQSYQELSTGGVNSFAFHPSGDFAVCVVEDAKIKILDLIEGRPIFTLYGPRTTLYATAFNQSGSLFATGGKDKEILIWKPILLPYTEDSTDSTELPSADKENTNAGDGGIALTNSVSVESMSRSSSQSVKSSSIYSGPEEFNE